MNTHQMNLNQITYFQAFLTKENKAYMNRLRSYLILASSFHRQEEKVAELLVSIYQDVLEAQEHGQSAEEFLGKDSKQLADQLLSDLPPLRWYYGLRLTGTLSLLYLGWLFLGHFGAYGFMELEWRGFLCDLLLGLLLPSSAFFILKSLVYEPSKLKAGLVMGAWGLLFVGTVGLRFWISQQFYEGITLPLWVSVLILLGIAAGIWYYRMDKVIKYTMIPAYVCLVLSGFSQVIASQFGYGPRDWTGWLPLIFMGISFLSTIIGVTVILKKDRQV